MKFFPTQQERQRIMLEGRKSIPRPHSERQEPEKSSGSEVGS